MTAQKLNQRRTRRARVSACVIVVCSTVSLAGTTALPRTGTAKFVSTWKNSSERYDLGEGYAVEAGLYWGVSVNSEGKGYLHKAAWRCSGASVGLNGNYTQHEYCVVTDVDGDKLYGPANGKVSPQTGLVGDMIYEHGTGKYRGITGKHNFVCRQIGSDGQAFCESEATWSFDRSADARARR